MAPYGCGSRLCGLSRREETVWAGKTCGYASEHTVSPWADHMPDGHTSQRARSHEAPNSSSAISKTCMGTREYNDHPHASPTRQTPSYRDTATGYWHRTDPASRPPYLEQTPCSTRRCTSSFLQRTRNSSISKRLRRTDIYREQCCLTSYGYSADRYACVPNKELVGRSSTRWKNWPTSCYARASLCRCLRGKKHPLLTSW
jgi:hypothetical protein